jgi:hypothetical protein
MAKIRALREQLSEREGANMRSPTSAVVNKLISRIEVLETEVRRLTRVVEEAVEVRHDMREREPVDGPRGTGESTEVRRCRTLLRTMSE